MKRIVIAAIGSLILITNVAMAQTNSGSEIIKAMNKAADDWNKGELESYMSLYTPSATMMMPTGRVGLDSIRSLYVRYYFVGKMPKQELSYDNYQVTMLGTGYALLTGRFTLKANGPLKQRSGIFTLIFVHQKEGWKLLHDHSG
jgi:ketosteroid isomerase-like protein